MTTIFDFSRFPTLDTPRLHLRQITYDDVGAMIAIFGAPESLRFSSHPPTDTPEKAVELIDWLNGLYDTQRGVQWGITLRDENRLIGACGSYGWDRDNRRVDMGYHILPSHWNLGYATEASHAIIRWSFNNLNLHRIQADCTDGHIASERVLLKCGFKVEGLWRESCWEHGRFVDIKQFGLLRREYNLD